MKIIGEWYPPLILLLTSKEGDGLRGILEGDVQGFKNTTPYVFFGNWPVITLCFIALLGWIMRHSKLLWILKKK